MRARYTIGHRTYYSGWDDLGNEVDGWHPPVDLAVYAIAPAPSTADAEPSFPSRNAVVTGLAVYLPSGGPELGPHDHYVIDGEEWEQDGRVQDYTRGPFGSRVGQLVLRLKRVTG